MPSCKVLHVLFHFGDHILGESALCAICYIITMQPQIIIGIMLDKQPLYIKGVDDSDKGATNCYLGGK